METIDDIVLALNDLLEADPFDPDDLLIRELLIQNDTTAQNSLPHYFFPAFNSNFTNTGKCSEG